MKNYIHNINNKFIIFLHSCDFLTRYHYAYTKHPLQILLDTLIYIPLIIRYLTQPTPKYFSFPKSSFSFKNYITIK